MPRKKVERNPIFYWTDGYGRWWSRLMAVRCPEKVFLSGKCQGVKGHAGIHWCFSPCGDLQTDDNKDDPQQGGCSHSIPAGHKSYRSPVKMHKLYYLNFSGDSIELTDKKEIARLERNDMRDNETISRPVTDPEEVAAVEKIKKKNDVAMKKFNSGGKKKQK